MALLKIIGYWKGPQSEQYPHPSALVDLDWDEDEKQQVIDYLNQGKPIFHYRGFSWCRFGCSREVDMGTSEMTDGEFVWPEGFVHYVVEHNIKPPTQFIQQCKNPFPEFDVVECSNAYITDGWWLAKTKDVQNEE